MKALYVLVAVVMASGNCLSLQPDQPAYIDSSQTIVAQGTSCERCEVQERKADAPHGQNTSFLDAPLQSWLQAGMIVLSNRSISPAASAAVLLVDAPPDLRPAEKNIVPFISSSAPTTGAIAVEIPRETPTEAMTHRFFDRQNIIGFAVHGAVRVADSTQSCILLGRSGRQEAWLPTKTCASITAYSLSMVATQILGSYGLHRGGYHALERWLPYAWAAPSAAGIAVSIKAW